MERIKENVAKIRPYINIKPHPLQGMGKKIPSKTLLLCVNLVLVSYDLNVIKVLIDTTMILSN